MAGPVGAVRPAAATGGQPADASKRVIAFDANNLNSGSDSALQAAVVGCTVVGSVSSIDRFATAIREEDDG